MVFRGLNHLDAAFDVVTSLALFGVVSGFAYSLGFPVPIWLIAALPFVAATASLGGWYQLRVDPDRIELRTFRSWVIPNRARVFTLDADARIYETLDSSRPQGLFLHSPDIEQSDSEAFGPYFSVSKMQRRCDAMQAAIERARVQAPRCTKALRLRLLAGAHDELDISGAVRDERGRLRQIRSIAPLSIGSVALPVGAVFVLNRDGFIDPSRDDTLERVRITSSLELKEGLHIEAGAELVFDEGGQLNVVHGASGHTISFGGHVLRGDQPIGFDAAGRLQTYTIAEPEPLGGFVLPANTKLSTSIKVDALAYHTTAWLGGTLTLPDVELRLGETMYFDSKDRLVAISPRRDLDLHGYHLRHGYMPMPTHLDGRIDLKKCHAKGLVGEARPII